MPLPTDFFPLAAVMSDWHMLSPVEKELYFYLKEHGFRNHVQDRLWDKVFRVFEAEAFARRTIRAIRNHTPNLISLGDFFVTVNEFGLAAQWTRLAGLWLRDFVRREFGWPNVIWVPGDHDIGKPHPFTGSGERPRLYQCQREFEQTESFKKQAAEATERAPECRSVITQPSNLDPVSAICTSIEAQQQIFNPLWGSQDIERDDGSSLRVIWLSDILLEMSSNWHHQKKTGLPEEALTVAGRQDQYLRYACQVPLKKSRGVILCVHRPAAARLLHEEVFERKWPKNLALIVCGHRHWAPRGGRKDIGGVPRVICPNVAGLRGVPGGSGGGLVIGEYLKKSTLRAYRYNVQKDTYRRVL